MPPCQTSYNAMHFGFRGAGGQPMFALSKKAKAVMETAGNRTNAGLSAREAEILQLVAQGYTSKEIASRLYLAKDTIETHKKAMVKKNSVMNSTALVAEALRRGWIK